MMWKSLIAAGAAFAISAVVSAILALRSYDAAIETGNVPPEKTWSTRFGLTYVQQRPPNSRSEAMWNAVIHGCKVGLALAFCVGVISELLARWRDGRNQSE